MLHRQFQMKPWTPLERDELGLMAIDGAEVEADALNKQGLSEHRDDRRGVTSLKTFVWPTNGHLRRRPVAIDHSYFFAMKAD